MHDVPAALIRGLGPVLPGSELPAGLRAVLGRSPFQRHLHQLARLGVRRCVVAFEGPAPETVQEECLRQRESLGSRNVPEVHFRPAGAESEIDALLRDAAEILVLDGSTVFDRRLYEAARTAAGAVDLVDSRDPGDGRGGSEAYAATGRRIGLAKVPPGTAVDSAAPVPVESLSFYVPELRRHLRPFWVPIRTERDRAQAGDRILDAAQKGVLDFPARFLHPLLEDPITRMLAETRVTPNHVTLLTAVLGFAATYLFALGAYAWGLGLALLVNVLDGVDGKLARVKLQASRFGDRLDHVLDVSFEFSWYAAIGWSLSRELGTTTPLEVGAGLILVMIGCRAASGAYRAITGHQIHDHTRFDAAFRLIAGRRNIYMLLLVAGLLAGRLEAALYTCFWWGAATLGVYLVRILTALAVRRRAGAEGRPG